MKKRHIVFRSPLLFSTGLLIFSIVRPAEVIAQPAIPEVGNLLSSYRFDDTNWLTAQGYPPRGWANVQTVPTWYTNAMRITGSGPAYLNYNCAETNWTNVTVSRGCVMFWCRPRWSGTNVSGGSGPGTSGRLFDIGTYTGDASIGWWSLHLNSEGTRIYFGGQTNGQTGLYLDAPIEWQSNTWHMVALNYTATNSSLFLDGFAVVTNGLGAVYWPGDSVLSNGFFVGSDSSGSNLAKADFESMRIYDGLMPDDIIASFYVSTRVKIDAWEAGGGGGDSIVAGDGEGGGVPSGSCTNGVQFVSPPLISGTNLLLNLCGGPTNGTYDLYFITNVTPVRTWTWLTRSAPGVNQFIVSDYPPPVGFFVLGKTNDVDGDGMTDAWEELVSHTATNVAQAPFKVFITQPISGGTLP